MNSLLVFVVFLEFKICYSFPEFLFHRVVFLVVGMVLMLLSRVLSESLVFYYGSAMTIGIILVILMILFQVMLSFLIFLDCCISLCSLCWGN